MSIDKPVPFISLNDIDNSFSISSESIDYFRSIEGPIAIVSIAGLYRTGKSYLLNLLLGRENVKDMFGVGGTINAFTKGIWIWGQRIDPIHTKLNENKKKEKEKENNITVIFMDTEGLGSTQRSTTQDTRIFALALLLSSYFIYNSRGVIDSNAIEDLSLVVHLTKYIQIKTRDKESLNNHSSQSNNNLNESLAYYFPSFLWVVRDFALQLQEDGKVITSKDYLEKGLRLQGKKDSNNLSDKDNIRTLISTFFPDRDCITMVRPIHDEKLLQDIVNQPISTLRPEFLAQLDELKKKVFTSLRPKQIMKNNISGSMFILLAENYIEAFNKGMTPVISNAWDNVLLNQCEEIYRKATKDFKEKFHQKTLDLYKNLDEGGIPFEYEQLENRFNDCKNTIENTILCNKYIDFQSFYPFLQCFNTFTIDIYENTIDTNLQISQKYNEHLLNDLYKTLQSKHNEKSKNQINTMDMPTMDLTLELENSLIHYIEGIKNLIKEYSIQGKGPCKDTTLEKFLSDKLIEGIFTWKDAIINFYKQKINEIQSSMNKINQNLRLLKGKMSVSEEILIKQKESHDQSIHTIEERLKNDKQNFQEEIQNKQKDIERITNQIDQLDQLNNRTLERLTNQITETKEEIKNLEDKNLNERNKRQVDLHGVSKELIEKEKTFHQEEKNLIQKQQELLSNVLHLEKVLNEQETNHMKEIYQLEKNHKEIIQELQDKYEENQTELKKKTVEDIKLLKNQQENEIIILNSELNSKEALISALKEQIIICKNKKINNNNNIPVHSIKTLPTSPLSNESFKKKEECLIQ